MENARELEAFCRQQEEEHAEKEGLLSTNLCPEKNNKDLCLAMFYMNY
jgi:hypothetical protein